MVYFIAVTIFIAIGLLTWSILFPILTRRSVILERLDQLTPKAPTLLSTPPSDGKMKNIFTWLGNLMPVSGKEQSQHVKMLVAAGYKKDSVYVFYGCKIFFVVALPAIYILVYSLTRENLAQLSTLLIIVALVIAGFLLPTYWLRYKLNKRQTEIFHTLPDMLDLLTVCVEAGLSMDSALIKATETPQFMANPLAMEIRIASREARAGKPRAEALRDMAERTMVDDVKSFVSMLSQTEKFGTSLSQALRVHSDSLRTKRRQIAEEAAAKTSIKLIFPLALFIFPALLVVILGPAIIQINKFMGNF
jgi:tight adherence protein C